MPAFFTVCGSIHVKQHTPAIDELLAYARDNDDNGPAEENNHFDEETNTIYLNTGGDVSISFQEHIGDLLDAVGAMADPCVVHCNDGNDKGVIRIGANECAKKHAYSKYITDEFLERLDELDQDDLNRVFATIFETSSRRANPNPPSV